MRLIALVVKPIHRSTEIECRGTRISAMDVTQLLETSMLPGSASEGLVGI